jgi:hypothetical protein
MAALETCVRNIYLVYNKQTNKDGTLAFILASAQIPYLLLAITLAIQIELGFYY